MYIAVTNAHGWARAESVEEALAIALGHSSRKHCSLARVWPCEPEAYCSGIDGTPYGVLTQEYEEFRRNVPNGRKWKKIN